MVIFGDAVESVAWIPESTYRVRYTPRIGCLQLISSATNYEISTTIDGGEPINLYSHPTGVVSYRIRGVTPASAYKESVEGDDDLMTLSSDGLSNIVLQRIDGWARINMDFKVRITHVKNTIIQGENVDLIKIWVIVITTSNKSYSGEFDLTASGNRTTGWLSPQPYVGTNVTVTVGLWQRSSSVDFKITSSKVYFQLIVGEVSVFV